MNDDSDLPTGQHPDESPDGASLDGPGEALEARPAPASALSSPGTRLRIAREALNFSLEDVALQLKVASRKIAALEQEQWSEMPERPYLRGLVRNYARVLHIDAERILDDIDRDRGGVAAPGVFSLTPGLRAPFPQRTPGVHDSATSRLMMVGVLICVLVICVIVFSKTSWFAKVEAMVVSALHPGAAAEAPTSLASADGARLNLSGHLERTDLPDPISAQAKDTPSPPVISPPLAQKPAAPLAALSAPASQRATPDEPRAIPPAIRSSSSQAGTTALVMQFKDDSWVELKDGDGKVSSQLYKGGTEQTLDVKPPLEMVIGNAPVVSVSYQGRALDLDPYTHARVARLNLP